MTAFTPRDGMRLDDFMTEMGRQPFELIDGEKHPKRPTVFDPMLVVHALYGALARYLSVNPIGVAFIEGTFILPDLGQPDWVRGARIPDVMFIRNEALAAFRQSPLARPGAPLAVVPDLVIEVLSPTDSYSEVERKVDVYLADGVRMVWAVDPQRKAATAWLANQTAVRLSASDALDGRDVLAGFSVSLGEVFATLPAPPTP
ncbi:MAG: Uma2 family endonuclease [Anaerolineae bacterium]|nr:Uma2 family endonuclease [Anaerolineae bacterium]